MSLWLFWLTILSKMTPHFIIFLVSTSFALSTSSAVSLRLVARKSFLLESSSASALSLAASFFMYLSYMTHWLSAAPNLSFLGGEVCISVSCQAQNAVGDREGF